jgi:hypothetical protein
MKHTYSCLGIYALFLLLFPMVAHTQAPDWQSVVATSQEPAGRGGAVDVNATAVDANGDVYLVGSFRGAARFGTFGFAYDFHDPGMQMFVAKWSRASQRFVWAIANGVNEAEAVATGVVINGSNIYVTGQYSFGRLTLGGIALPSRSGTNLFVVKLTDLGTSATVTWWQQFGCNPDYYYYTRPTRTIAINGQDIYIAGKFKSTLQDPVAHFGGINLTPASDNAGDLFIAKLHDEGNSSQLVWVQPAGGTANEEATALAVQDDHLYVAGTFASNPTVFGSTSLTPTGPRSLFVSKLLDRGASAEFEWTRQAGGEGDAKATDLAVRDNNIYVAGRFTGTANFGTDQLTSVGTGDVFITKLLDAGSTAAFSWTQQIATGTMGWDTQAMLGISGNGVYAAGTFTGALELGAFPLTSAGGKDVFLAQLTDMGTSSQYAWVKQAGGSGNDESYSVSVSDAGTVCVGGVIGADANFGSMNIDGSAGYRGFLATLQGGTGLAASVAKPLATMQLYPNPAHASTTVNIPAQPGTATATLTLLDALGRTVHTRTTALSAAGLRQELDLTGLSPGLYALRVSAGPASTTRRLVVE